MSSAPSLAHVSSEAGGPWVLCYFLHRYLDFRVPEVESLAEMAGCGGALEWRLPEGDSPHAPFRWLRLPTLDCAAAVVAHSLLIKVLLDVWGEGATLQECVTSVLACPEAKRAPYLGANTTFRVVIDGFGVRHSVAEQRAIFEGTAAIPFLGKVDLKTPEHTFYLIETHGHGSACLPGTQKRFYFGRQLGSSDRSVGLQALDLSGRRYLGPTSMDHEVALIMCNQGLVRPGTLVHDPFVGTGSILQAAAHRGALTMGTDIDVRVLRDGKIDKASGQRVTVWSNFEDARLAKPLALLHCDLAQMPLRQDLEGWAHAFVCDPPYGVRAGGRKSGGRKRDENGQAFAVPEHLRHNHVPSTAFYPLSECLADLLDLAAKSLVMQGRLVYFYPAPLEAEGEEGEAELPTHPCLQLLANSLQTLSGKWGRRLLTMRKVKEWYPQARAEAAERAGCRQAGAASDAVRHLFNLPPGAEAAPEKDKEKHKYWETYRGKRT